MALKLINLMASIRNEGVAKNFSTISFNHQHLSLLFRGPEEKTVVKFSFYSSQVGIASTFHALKTSGTFHARGPSNVIG